jgi:bifunctional polynucleotide phosphatase/kinase
MVVVTFATVVKGTVPADYKEAVKIAGFDMDSTLIKTKSGMTFARSYKDWIPWDDKVKPKLEELVTKGYRVVVFTNQAGVEAGMTNVLELDKKFKMIQEHFGIPMIFFAATMSDKYRKPALGMWEHLKA